VNERADRTIEVHGAVLIVRGASGRGCRYRDAARGRWDSSGMGVSKRQNKLNRQGEQRQAATDAYLRSDPTHTAVSCRERLPMDCTMAMSGRWCQPRASRSLSRRRLLAQHGRSGLKGEGPNDGASIIGSCRKHSAPPLKIRYGLFSTDSADLVSRLKSGLP
jgi:hypothetical protein